MGKKFSLAEYVKDDMSKMNTGMEQITLLPLESLIPDERNFYSLDGIEELAANIETVGLLDPIRVRPQDGEYIIVSGHRRRAACMLIRDGGNPMFDRGVPCIIELGEASDAMRELRLIFANSATRQLTSAELSKQAERTNAVLLQLKKEGFEFKGKTRELVAEILHVSESKVARVSAIRKNLIPLFLEKYDSGLIGESVAYRLSQEPAELQKEVWAGVGISIHGCTAENVDMIIDQVKKRRETPQDSRAVEDAGPYRSKFDVEAYLAERAEEDADFRELLLGTAKEFFDGLTGVCSRQDGITMLKESFGSCHAGWYHGGPDVACSPKGVTLSADGFEHKITRTWTEVYDLLSTIAINGEAVKNGPPRASAPTSSDAEPEWMTGDPPRPGRYFCRVDMETTKPIENRCTWNGEFWEIYGAKLDERWKVIGWWPLPEEVLT